ncbi:MAG: hypothetical protein ACT4OV_16125 [Microthrixaceae bacterium]
MTVARRGRSDVAGALGARVIRAEDLRRFAEGVAVERSAERAATRERLDAATARATHDLDTATSQLDHLIASRQRLLDGARWAVAAEAELPSQVAALTGARAAVEARQVDERTAQHALDRVLEQRAAASAAIESAEGDLEELSSAATGENDLRRELEAAGHAVRVAHDAHVAAVTRVQDLMHESDQIALRCADLLETLGGHPKDRPRDADFDRVLAALDAWVQATRGAELDPYAQALADALEELHADLTELEPEVGPNRDTAAIRQAEAELENAMAALRNVEGAAPRSSLSPEDRAALAAARQAVEQASEQTSRRVRRAAAERRLDEARAAERALLDQHGFASHLDIVMSGGRTAPPSPARLEAERRVLEARAVLDQLQRVVPSSPELEHLHSERTRLLAHAAEHLGVDPGDAAVRLLRVHPLAPVWALDGLRVALASVGVHPVGSDLATSAEDWLKGEAATAEENRAERAAAREAEAELERIEVRAAIVRDLQIEAREQEMRASQELAAAIRSADAVEHELGLRAGEDPARLHRLVAAEQLRTQVDALATTLARAEQDARSHFDRVAEAVDAAEAVFDKAQSALAEVAQRARLLGEELPIAVRPTGDRLETLDQLAVRLVEHAEVVQPSIDRAETVVAVARTRVEEAMRTAEAAGTGNEAPRAEDIDTALDRLLTEHREGLLALDEPLALLDPEHHLRLLGMLVLRAAEQMIVLLSDDPKVLGWAIELPADQAEVVAAESLLNLAEGSVETKATCAVVDLVQAVADQP